jgi:hypothetical protein
MEQFTVACSPLTSTIYAGRPTKKGMWGAKKHDVTIPAVHAVAQHLIQRGEDMEFTYKAERYRLQVIKIQDKQA